MDLPSNVCIVGLGGLGCPASLVLAQIGVQKMTLVDPDRVDLTNLHRQLWHHPADVGRLKVESAGSKLAALYPCLSLTLRPETVNAENAYALFQKHSVVIDGTDGAHTKFLLSDVSIRSGVPLIYAGVLRFQGLVMRLQARGPCLRCLFEHLPDDVPSCAQAGVLGSMAGLIGSLQARLALTPEPRAGYARLHVLDGWNLRLKSLMVRRRADCSSCGKSALFNSSS